MCRSPLFSRQALRAAARIHDQLTRAARTTPWAELPVESWEEAVRVASRLRYVVARGWSSAARALLEDLAYVTRQLGREINQFESNLPPADRPEPIVSLREVVEDLLALRQEFPQSHIELGENSVSVVTEPIELEGVSLGPFRIALFWKDIGRRQPYEVVAESPLPSSENDEVTHPHVAAQRLCEGSGAPAIQAALSKGRILDFFVLVNQVLQTYNPSSAHVPLDRWTGSPCHECGTLLASDEARLCERCEEPVCGDCTGSCGSCGYAFCSSCLGRCAQCEQPFCDDCLHTPDGSNSSLCETCFQQYPLQEDGHVTCFPSAPKLVAADDSAPSPETETRSAATDAATDPLCLGKAPLPS